MDSHKYGGDDYYAGAIFPESRDEAIAYIDRCWDIDGVLSGCEALVDFRIESRRVLSAWTADRLWIDPGVPRVIEYCYVVPSGPDIMEVLRDTVDGEDEYNTLIATAYHHLEQAATLMHVHPTLFLGLPKSVGNKSKEEYIHSRGGWAKLPKIDGEDRREASFRQTLYNHAKGIRKHIGGGNSDLVRKSDRRKGSGGRAANPSTNKLFVRMLWDAWPAEMRENHGDWRPKITAREMLIYCGHEEVTANDFHRYADEVKARDVNAKRRKHEVPGKSLE